MNRTLITLTAAVAVAAGGSLLAQKRVSGQVGQPVPSTPGGSQVSIAPVQTSAIQAGSGSFVLTVDAGGGQGQGSYTVPAGMVVKISSLSISGNPAFANLVKTRTGGFSLRVASIRTPEGNAASTNHTYPDGIAFLAGDKINLFVAETEEKGADTMAYAHGVIFRGR